MTIQWYPGHIAKAERELKEQLKLVDVVLEVLDARIPLVSHHPQVPQWVGSKQRVLTINRVDMISPKMRDRWIAWFKEQGETPYFTNAKDGTGVKAVAKAAKAAGIQVNERRASRGMLPRPVRAVAIGFPNVGKSALINRLLGRRVVESARRPGVTRRLRWTRISKELELLDAPGVIPSKLEDQTAALKLAICDDIGDAGYDNQRVAAGLVDLLGSLASAESLQPRYKLDPTPITGEEYIYELAELRYRGDMERAARVLLNDFRTGLLGQISLDLPPEL
ncbi:MAG: ribosome biogenesis GTPase YlqF [Oscillatoria sp. SIO1A7]|nr:ribosome biogenesis GTPase YlqF [Oscillatoria sp. SIO1A7]